MPEKIRTKYKIKSSWREYQIKLKKSDVRKKRKLKSLKILAALPFIFFAVSAVVAEFVPISLPYRGVNNSPKYTNVACEENTTLLAKQDIQAVFDKKVFFNLKDNIFNFTFNGKPCQVETSLNQELQQYMIKRLDKTTSRYIGVVLMEPDSGKVLSMIGYDRIDPLGNDSFFNGFPTIVDVGSASASSTSACSP